MGKGVPKTAALLAAIFALLPKNSQGLFKHPSGSRVKDAISIESVSASDLYLRHPPAFQKGSLAAEIKCCHYGTRTCVSSCETNKTVWLSASLRGTITLK